MGAGLLVLGGSRAGGTCRMENRALVASPLDLESGQGPGLALRGLPQDGPGQETPITGDTGQRAGGASSGSGESDTAVSPEPGLGASEPP